MTKFILKVKKWTKAKLKEEYVPVQYNRYYAALQKSEAIDRRNHKDMFFLWNYKFRYGFLGSLRVKFFKKVLKIIETRENRIKVIPITDENFDDNFNYIGKK